MDTIQWFPGHMAKAMRKMEEALPMVDGVILILDARCPNACINDKLVKMFSFKPVLYVLNKADLADPVGLKRVTESFVKDKKQVVCIDAKSKKDISGLYGKIFELLKEKVERNKAKGYFKPVRIMVAGIPNTGKSTIINALVGGKKAQVGDKAGVTRSNQWVKLNELELLDTPGTMPPSFEDQVKAKHLAYVGCINDAIMDLSDLCLELIAELTLLYPDRLKERYRLTDLDKTPIEIYEDICQKRGFLIKGGDFDYERCATAVIDDLRSGKLGRVIFE
ncbi:MAG: ribosome biogenesis GTPase YlqF [Clostridia bacterium]|nr:ribosome biogenesis GTPase YlqF [Clostridia bacterium]